MKILNKFFSLFKTSKKITKKRNKKKTLKKKKSRLLKMKGGWGGFIPSDIYITDKKDIQKGGWGGATNLNI